MASGEPGAVQARTFILNYFAGTKVDAKKFDVTETTPELCSTGQRDDEWEALRKSNSKLWEDKALKRAGQEFAALVKAQRSAFVKGTARVSPDYPEKATNPAILDGVTGLPPAAVVLSRRIRSCPSD